MKKADFICIHNQKTDIIELHEKLVKIKKFFINIIVVSDFPDIVSDFDFDIVFPFRGFGLFDKIYSGLFFMENEKALVSDSDFLPEDFKHLEILLKNIHKSVDCAAFYREEKILFLPAAYSSSIIKKFNCIYEKESSENFFKRLKINKIKA